jgi:hypothetical protein
MAAFHLIIYGRFWVITEVYASGRVIRRNERTSTAGMQGFNCCLL